MLWGEEAWTVGEQLSASNTLRFMSSIASRSLTTSTEMRLVPQGVYARGRGAGTLLLLRRQISLAT